MRQLRTFGGRLEHALRIRGIGKMYALAVSIGVAESAISRWRRGKAISTTNLVKLCAALELSVDWLLTGRGDMTYRESGKTSCVDALEEKIASLTMNERTHLAEVLQAVTVVCQQPQWIPDNDRAVTGLGDLRKQEGNGRPS